MTVCPNSFSRQAIGILMAFALTLIPARNTPAGPKKRETLKLGGQALHERLRVFKARFPGSVCGTAVPFYINRHTLDDPDDSGWLSCCIDDPAQVKTFSEFRILSLGDCPVLVTFYHKFLESLSFAVDAASVEECLPPLIKAYGPPHNNYAYREDERRTSAVWWFDDDKLELIEGQPRADLRFDAPLTRSHNGSVIQFEIRTITPDRAGFLF